LRFTSLHYQDNLAKRKCQSVKSSAKALLTEGFLAKAILIWYNPHLKELFLEVVHEEYSAETE